MKLKRIIKEYYRARVAGITLPDRVPVKVKPDGSGEEINMPEELVRDIRRSVFRINLAFGSALAAVLVLLVTASGLMENSLATRINALNRKHRLETRMHKGLHILSQRYRESNIIKEGE